MEKERNEPVGCGLNGKTMISTDGTFGDLYSASCASYCSLRPGASLSALLAMVRSAVAMSSDARSETVWRERKVTPVVARATAPPTPPLHISCLRL